MTPRSYHYGLGTNTGLKAVSAGNHGVGYRDLLYVRRRFITRDHLRAAIQDMDSPAADRACG